MTFADTRDALWNAVLDRPADDVPRAMLADHLLESDDPAERAHGELIRVQLELDHEESGYVLDWSSPVDKVHYKSSNPKIRHAADLCHGAASGRWGLGSTLWLLYSVWKRGFPCGIRASLYELRSWLPGVVAERRWPLERAWPTDARPFRHGDWYVWERSARWWWSPGNGWVPADVYDRAHRLYGHFRRGVRPGTLEFSTERDAQDALAHALLDLYKNPDPVPPRDTGVSPALEAA